MCVCNALMLNAMYANYACAQFALFAYAFCVQNRGEIPGNDAAAAGCFCRMHVHCMCCKRAKMCVCNVLMFNAMYANYACAQFALFAYVFFTCGTVGVSAFNGYWEADARAVRPYNLQVFFCTPAVRNVLRVGGLRALRVHFMHVEQTEQMQHVHTRACMWCMCSVCIHMLARAAAACVSVHCGASCAVRCAAPEVAGGRFRAVFGQK